MVMVQTPRGSSGVGRVDGTDVTGGHRSSSTGGGPPRPPRRHTVPVETGWLDRHAHLGLLVLTAAGASLAVGTAVAFEPLYGFAVAVAIVGGLVVLARPAVGGYLLVGVVPIVSGLRRGFPVPQLRLSEALIVGLGVIILLTANHRQAVRWTVVDWLLLAWAAGWCVIGGFNVISLHQHPDLRKAEMLLGPLQFVLLYRAVVTALPLRDQRRKAVGLFMWASVPVSLLALAQQLRIAAVQRLIANITGSTVFQDYSYHYFARATGPFPHWTPLAGYLFVILVTGFALLFEGAGPLSTRQLAIVLLLASTGLVLSAELSALAGTIFGVCVLAAWYKRVRQAGRWMGVGAVVLGAAFGSYLGSRLNSQFGSRAAAAHTLMPQTIAYRIQVWTHQYFPVIGQRPLTGWGPVLPASVVWPFTESQYVTMLMAGGVPLLCAYIGLMAALYGIGRRVGDHLSPDADGRPLGRSLAIVICALIVMNAIFPYFTDGGLSEPFWVLAALVAGSMRPRLPGHLRDAAIGVPA